MSSAKTVVEEIESAGGRLELNGNRLRCRIPKGAAHLIENLRSRKNEVLLLLQQREQIPKMPAGVRLRRWEPKPAPVILTRCTVVIDVGKFILTTLIQLNSALLGRAWLSGNWSVRELIDRLDQCGVIVEVEEPERPASTRGGGQ